jgi:hypothetical protein
MKTQIIFKLHDETELPQEIIDDAPSSGRFDEFADYILKTYDVQCSLEDSIKYLKTLGAWELDELQDIDLNLSRLLWISILDCKENETQYWYMGD